MLDWIVENAATLIITLLIAAALAAALAKIIRDKRRGNTCGSCSGCSKKNGCDQ